MGVRSVIDVDINDQKFKDFTASFEKYTKALKATKGDWSDAAVSAAAAAAATADINAELDKQAETQKRLEADNKKAAKEEERRIKAAAAEMEKLNRTVKSIASNLASGTTSLLKWVGIGGILSGLMGAGGLFGLDRLAESLGGARRSAGGLGINSGQQQAANLNFGRFVDTNQALGGIASAQTNADLWAFRAVGIDPTGKDPATLLAELLPKAQKIFKPLAGKPMAEYNARVQALQALGLSMSDLRRLAEAPDSEVRGAAGRYYGDARTLRMDPRTQQSWQDFDRALHTAGQNIENALGRGLEKITPGLEKLSGALVEIVDKFVGSKGFDQLVTDLETGIENFAKYLTSPKFKDDMKTFVEDFEAVAKALHDGLKWLGIIPKSQAEKDADQKKADEFARQAQGGFGFPYAAGMGMLAGISAPSSMVLGSAGFQQAAFSSVLGGSGGGSGGGGGRLPRNVLGGAIGAIYALESGSGANPGRSSKGALGPFQFMPDTARQYGVQDRTDFAQSKRGAEAYLGYLLKLFHGDLAKALAGYNWGEGNVQKDIKNHGADWLRFAPKETQEYVRKGLKLSINNNTGGNANVQMNQGGASI